MTSTGREEDRPELREALSRLRSLDEATPMAEAVQHAVDAAASLFSITGSGVLLVDEAHVLHYVAASDGHGRELERAQERAGTGPCVEAVILDVVIKTEDVTADARWPGLHEALRATRVRAVLGVPIHVGGTVAGSIDAYRDEPHEWQPSEIDGMVAFAGLIERMLLDALRAERQDRVVQQLEHALRHRVTIERAVGVLMERERLDAVRAFERVRSEARASRRRVVEVASDILAGRCPT